MRRISKFYAVYFALLFVSLIAIVIGMMWLWGYLDEYEGARPKYVAKEVFDTYFADGEFTRVAEAAYNGSPFEDPDDLAVYLKELCRGKTLSYSSVSSGDNETERYIVKADDKKVAAFTVKKGESVTKRGFPIYVKDSFEVYVAPKESVTVLLPEKATLTVNSVSVSEEYITDSDITLIPPERVPEGITPVKYDLYTVDGLLFEPELRVNMGDGEMPLVYNEKEERYETVFPSDEALQAEHGTFILDAVKEYARYLQRDSQLAAVRPYFDTASELYYSIATVDQQYAIDHVGDRFEDEYTGEFYAYDENTFSCRVSVNQILTFYTGEEFVDPIDMTVYLRRVGDRFLIFDWYLTDGEDSAR